MEWLRSQPYLDYFDLLDHDGGFYYERWGDAPVHSIAASLLLNRDEVHFFDEIAYYHIPLTHCPTEESKRLKLKCSCNPDENFDWKPYSCMYLPFQGWMSTFTDSSSGTSRYFQVNKMKKPDGWEDQANP